MEKKIIKLVIWDLDNTFWKGTLAENDKIEIIEDNINIVKELVNRGIMNSIVSKNDYEEAKKILVEMGIFDYFIFPNISWESKGETVKKLLSVCKLRPDNVLFIDDNISNLEEVKYYNPNITAVLPEYIYANRILDKEEFQGKNDKAHDRLRQYKLLEKRYKAERKSSSNIEFLRNSHIKVYLGGGGGLLQS